MARVMFMAAFLYAMVVLILILAAVMTFRMLTRRWRRRERHREEGQICRGCGYNLEGLQFPRCPECGALWGFTVPAEQLGLSEQELRELYAQRQASAQPAPTPEDHDQT
ncbi:MAG: hypothetical protein AMXMBFR13_32380 [Phycisphaerae bacterium]